MSNQISAVGRQLVAPYFDVSQEAGDQGGDWGDSGRMLSGSDGAGLSSTLAA